MVDVVHQLPIGGLAAQARWLGHLKGRRPLVRGSAFIM